MDARELLNVINEDELFSYIESVYNPDDHSWSEVWSIDGSGGCSNIKQIKIEEVLRLLDKDDGDCNGDYPDFYWVPKQCEGSDYSGGTVNRANYLAISEEYEEESLVALLYGGHNTYAIAVSIRELINNDSDEAKKLIETLIGLQDYPVVDDERLCKYEMELIDKAWEGWVKDNFISSIEKKFKIELTDNKLREFFTEMINKANMYWEADGVDMYIDVDKVVDSIDINIDSINGINNG